MVSYLTLHFTSSVGVDEEIEVLIGPLKLGISYPKAQLPLLAPRLNLVFFLPLPWFSTYILLFGPLMV